jgi:hypothetical protein
VDTKAAQPIVDTSRLIVIKWVDAVSDGGWEEHEKPDIHEVVTAGYVVSETKDAVCIASTVSGTFTNARMHIPKAWIKSRKVIKVESKYTKPKSVKDGRNGRGKSMHEVSSVQDVGQLQN